MPRPDTGNPITNARGITAVGLFALGTMVEIVGVISGVVALNGIGIACVVGSALGLKLAPSSRS